MMGEKSAVSESFAQERPDERPSHGIMDPAEPLQLLPEGLRRKRKGPLNPRTGRRPDTDSIPSETG